MRRRGLNRFCTISPDIAIARLKTYLGSNSRTPKTPLDENEIASIGATSEGIVAACRDASSAKNKKFVFVVFFQLIYVSTAVWPMSNDDLVRLLLQARARNERRSLTGMLLYKDGHFMEVLEGDELNVKSVFADIETDGRHKSIDILRSGPIESRDFPNWTMGFENFESAAVPSLTRFLEPDFKPDYFAEETVEAHAILLAFKGVSLMRGEN
jgi:hypothetical protein